MVVHVDMKHSNLVVERELQSLPYGGRSHHCPYSGVIKIVLVFHWLVVIGKDDNAFWLHARCPANKKTNSFRRKFVRASEVMTNPLK
jgi:hypothetical protein